MGWVIIVGLLLWFAGGIVHRHNLKQEKDNIKPNSHMPARNAAHSAAGGKEYKIFKHPQGKIEAVKQGWSWPAFFFLWWWALSKRLWNLAIGSLIVSVLPYALIEAPGFVGGIAWIGLIAICVAFGITGTSGVLLVSVTFSSCSEHREPGLFNFDDLALGAGGQEVLELPDALVDLLSNLGVYSIKSDSRRGSSTPFWSLLLSKPISDSARTLTATCPAMSARLARAG